MTQIASSTTTSTSRRSTLDVIRGNLARIQEDQQSAARAEEDARHRAMQEAREKHAAAVAEIQVHIDELLVTLKEAQTTLQETVSIIPQTTDVEAQAKALRSLIVGTEADIKELEIKKTIAETKPIIVPSLSLTNSSAALKCEREPPAKQPWWHGLDISEEQRLLGDKLIEYGRSDGTSVTPIPRPTGESKLVDMENGQNHSVPQHKCAFSGVMSCCAGTEVVEGYTIFLRDGKPVIVGVCRTWRTMASMVNVNHIIPGGSHRLKCTRDYRTLMETFQKMVKYLEVRQKEDSVPLSSASTLSAEEQQSRATERAQRDAQRRARQLKVSQQGPKGNHNAGGGNQNHGKGKKKGKNK